MKDNVVLSAMNDSFAHKPEGLLVNTAVQKPQGYLGADSSLRRSSNFAHFFGVSPPDTVFIQRHSPFRILKIIFSRNFAFVWIFNCTHGKLF